MAAVTRRQFLRGRFGGDMPWAPMATVGDQCLAKRRVECRACGDACEAGAIRFRPALGGAAQPEILDANCNGCGACLPLCPVGALTNILEKAVSREDAKEIQ